MTRRQWLAVLLLLPFLFAGCSALWVAHSAWSTGIVQPDPSWRDLESVDSV